MEQQELGLWLNTPGCVLHLPLPHPSLHPKNQQQEQETDTNVSLGLEMQERAALLPEASAELSLTPSADK